MNSPEAAVWREREVQRAVSTAGRAELVEQVVAVIDSAQEMVVVSSYLINHGATFESLRSAARRGCRIYVLTDSEEQLRLRRTHRTETEHREFKSYLALLKDLSTFAMVRSGNGIHAKAVLAIGAEQTLGDRSSRNASGLVMTANLRDGALGRNAELVVPLEGRAAWDLFRALRYAFFSVASHAYDDGDLKPVSSAGQFVRPDLPTLWLKTELDDEIERRVGKTVRDSLGEVVAMSHSWSIDHGVTRSLLDAAESGRRVTVIANSQVMSSVPVLRRMAKSGIHVFGRPHSHAKVVITSSSVCVSTANFKAFERASSSFDLGLEVTGPDADHIRSTVSGWVESAPLELNPAQIDGEWPIAEVSSDKPRRGLGMRNFGRLRQFRRG